jgi:uncharacterized alpha-E superfamily protein
MTRVATRAAVGVDGRGRHQPDTWVRTDGAVDRFRCCRSAWAGRPGERRPPVASRTAENLFWLGRYTERTEQAVRLARAALDLVDGDDDVPRRCWRRCRAWPRLQALVPTNPGAERSTALFERNLQAALAQRDSGIGFNLQALARAVGALRDRLSSEQWGLVRRMGDSFHGPIERVATSIPSPTQALAALQRLTLQLAALTGAQTDRMTRDHGWRLLSVGRLIERLSGMAATLVALLDAFDPRGASAATTELLLELFDSRITFRARYQRQKTCRFADLGLRRQQSAPRRHAAPAGRRAGQVARPDAACAALREMLPAHGAGLTLAELAAADDAAMREQLATGAAFAAQRVRPERRDRPALLRACRWRRWLSARVGGP